MTDKSQSPKAGDEEPNLHEMRKHVDAALLEIFQDWAFRQAQTWPHGQYSPHDFTPFFEKGALFGFAHARQSPDSRGWERLRKQVHGALEGMNLLNGAVLEEIERQDDRYGMHDIFLDLCGIKLATTIKELRAAIAAPPEGQATEGEGT